jgi:hypothetical protein
MLAIASVAIQQLGTATKFSFHDYRATVSMNSGHCETHSGHSQAFAQPLSCQAVFAHLMGFTQPHAGLRPPIDPTHALAPCCLQVEAATLLQVPASPSPLSPTATLAPEEPVRTEPVLLVSSRHREGGK